MTRLTPADVAGQLTRLRRLEEMLSEVAKLDLRTLALRASGRSPVEDDLFVGARCAAIPVSRGSGIIAGFSRGVADVLSHLGCDAWVTERADMAGLREAVEEGADVLFVADDVRFVALDLRRGRCVDNVPATADGFVVALEAAAEGLRERQVLLLGLGPVGRAAAQGLVARGAVVQVVEPDAARLASALAQTPLLQPVSLVEGLEHCDLLYDATPAPEIIDVDDLRPTTIAAVPGVPSGFSVHAQRSLGARHIHDPLAIGVAVMAARALA